MHAVLSRRVNHCPNCNFMNLYRRIVSAVVILPPVLLLLLYASHSLFALFICIVAWFSLHEYFGLLTLKQTPIGRWLSHALALALVGAAYLQGLALMAPVLTLGVILLTSTALWRASEDTVPFQALMNSLFGVLFIAWGLGHVVALHGLDHGPMRTLLLCVVVWSGDIAALYVGRSFGGRRLAPAVSPGKTWAGALGGAAGSLLIAAAGARLLSLPLTISQSLLFGLLISGASQVGDLAESLLKRYIGVKDSGTLIPGHGGILDRLDSFFLAAPVAAYFFMSLDALTSR